MAAIFTVILPVSEFIYLVDGRGYGVEVDATHQLIYIDNIGPQDFDECLEFSRARLICRPGTWIEITYEGEEVGGCA